MLDSSTWNDEAPGGVAPPRAWSRALLSPSETQRRVPELQAYAQKLLAGQGSAAEYGKLVERFKPVTPYEHLPAPATDVEMVGAIGPAKAHRVGGALRQLIGGEVVGLRLDIPSFYRRGTWVTCVHDATSTRAVGAVLGYESTCAIGDAQFQVHQGAALKVAAGSAKSPMAVIRGSYDRLPQECLLEEARCALDDDEWIQVGMDPERHSYFYCRHTSRPVVRAQRVIQVGPLALARRVVFGELGNFLY